MPMQWMHEYVQHYSSRILVDARLPSFFPCDQG